MTEEQAQFTRKLYHDQSCSYQTVARKYYEEFGPTALCKDPRAVIYYDLDKNESVYHDYSNGDIPSSKYSIIEQLFNIEDGEDLVSQSNQLLGNVVVVFEDELEYGDIL
tara:strand:- start:277 stop:603 length:327 start_codon:yes stop_codon:yes gene_type:complete